MCGKYGIEVDGRGAGVVVVMSWGGHVIGLTCNVPIKEVGGHVFVFLERDLVSDLSR